MDFETWEHELVDRACAVAAHNRQGGAPLVLDIERSIGMVFDDWEPPDPDYWDLYRELCIAAAEGKSRASLLSLVRDYCWSTLFQFEAVIRESEVSHGSVPDAPRFESWSNDQAIR